MTNNQIEYQKLLETRRSNAAKEEISRQELAEKNRANLANEGLTARRDSATALHYINQDAISAGNLAVAQGQLDESIRHNTQTENDNWAIAENKNAVSVATTRGNSPWTAVAQGLATGVYESLHVDRQGTRSSSSGGTKGASTNVGSGATTRNETFGSSIGSSVAAAGKWLASSWDAISKGAKAGADHYQYRTYESGNS